MLIYFRYVCRGRRGRINWDLISFLDSKFLDLKNRFSSFFIEILKGFKIQNVFFSEIFLRSKEIFKIFKIHFFLRSQNVRNFDFFFEISKLSKFSKFSRYPFLKFRNSQNCLNLKSGMSFFSKVFFWKFEILEKLSRNSLFFEILLSKFLKLGIPFHRPIFLFCKISEIS